MKLNITTLITAVALPLSGAANATLLAHWSFDTNFNDASDNFNDLVVGNGTPEITTTPGEFVFGGGALDLEKSSNEFLTLSTGINFTNTDPWSVSFWGRKRAGAPNPSGMILGDNTTVDSFIWTPNNPNVVQGLRFRPAGVGTSVSSDYPTGHDGDFHHWVVVSDGSGDIRVYRDNVDLGTDSITGGADLNILAVGSGYTGTNQIYDGQLDEIYIFDEAIDAATVESLFTSNTIGSPVVPGDTDGDGDIDDADLGTSFANYTGPLAAGTGGKDASTGDTDGDGDVDDADLGTSFAGYTGPLGPASVPEPASLALLGLPALLFARRRRA